MEEEPGDASGSQLELIGRLKGSENTHTHIYSIYTLIGRTHCNYYNFHPEMSLESGGYKPRSRPPLPLSSSSSSASSGAGTPGGAAGSSGALAPPMASAGPRRGLLSAGRDSHDRCLEELEKER